VRAKLTPSLLLIVIVALSGCLAPATPLPPAPPALAASPVPSLGPALPAPQATVPPAQATALAAAVQTAAAPTALPEAAEPTAGPMPAAGTVAPGAPAAVPPAEQPVVFPPDNPTVILTDTLPAGESDLYRINGQGGQTLAVHLAFPTGDFAFGIMGADGTMLSEYTGAPDWTGVLTVTQDYTLDVHNFGAQQAGYTVQMTLTSAAPPVQAAAAPPPQPATPVAPAAPASPVARRIQFAPGATSATVQGQLAPRGMDRWVLNAGAGRTMTVQLAYSTGQAILIIYGTDGNVLISDHAGATQWSGQLPSTQDYFIDVRSVSDAVTNYTLTVTIPPATPPGPTVRRLNFASGATSATVQGQLAPGAIDRWVVKAAAGQTMSVVLNGNGQQVVAIWGADGTVLISQMAGATSWSGKLPKTQDYNIDVINSPAGVGNYSLTVTIPPLTPPGPTPTVQRINFAPGATSATVNGSAGPGSNRWVIKAGAGQTMTVQLSPAGGQVTLAIWGADGTVLISSAAGATSWTGVLPRTQDYYIDVMPGSPAATNYSLTVIIPPR
jgi:hypothetical protein